MLEVVKPSVSMRQQPPSFGRLTSPSAAACRLLCLLLGSRAHADAAPRRRQHGGGDGGAARGGGLAASMRRGIFARLRRAEPLARLRRAWAAPEAWSWAVAEEAPCRAARAREARNGSRYVRYVRYRGHGRSKTLHFFLLH